MSQRLANLEANLAIFTALPEAARVELSEDLDKIGAQVLAIQQSLAPVGSGRDPHPGNLLSGLTAVQALEQLRERIGYPDLRSYRNSRWYAIVQEYGRKAGSKTVTSKKTGKTRLVSWGAMAGRHFVHVEDRLDGIVDAILVPFWDKVRAKVGAA